MVRRDCNCNLKTRICLVNSFDCANLSCSRFSQKVCTFHSCHYLTCNLLRSFSGYTRKQVTLSHLFRLAVRKGGRTRPVVRFASKSRDDCLAVALFGRADDETVAVWKFVSCARYKTYPSNSTFSCSRQFNRRQVLIRVAVSVPNQTGKFR